MRSILFSLMILNLPLAGSSEPASDGDKQRVQELQQAEISFEQTYLKLQKRIESLKEKGEKISEDTRREMDSLMAEMNHQHQTIKRELERKDQELNRKLAIGKAKEEDWSKRLTGALHEVGGGIHRAWDKLSKGNE